MRADQLLVERGLAASRSQAQRLIAAGVRWLGPTGWQAITKNGDDLPAQAEIELVDTAEARYVSRGGLKLEGALAASGIAPADRVCLDAGQSTGGFTDCLLRQGAARVVGVDVGHGQLHPSLRADPRVTCLERINVRSLVASDLPVSSFDLIVGDLSFISLTLVLPALTVWRVLPSPSATGSSRTNCSGASVEPALFADESAGCRSLTEGGARSCGR